MDIEVYYRFTSCIVDSPFELDTRHRRVVRQYLYLDCPGQEVGAGKCIEIKDSEFAHPLSNHTRSRS